MPPFLGHASLGNANFNLRPGAGRPMEPEVGLRDFDFNLSVFNFKIFLSKSSCKLISTYFNILILIHFAFIIFLFKTSKSSLMLNTFFKVIKCTKSSLSVFNNLIITSFILKSLLIEFKKVLRISTCF